MKRRNKNRPSPFPGRISGATKHGFNFLCLFCVVVHFFWLENVCICCVRFSFIPHQAKRLAWGTSPKWLTLCRVGRITTTQSIVYMLSVKSSPGSSTNRLAMISACASSFRDLFYDLMFFDLGVTYSYCIVSYWHCERAVASIPTSIYVINIINDTITLRITYISGSQEWCFESIHNILVRPKLI